MLGSGKIQELFLRQRGYKVSKAGDLREKPGARAAVRCSEHLRKFVGDE